MAILQNHYTFLLAKDIEATQEIVSIRESPFGIDGISERS